MIITTKESNELPCQDESDRKLIADLKANEIESMADAVSASKGVDAPGCEDNLTAGEFVAILILAKNLLSSGGLSAKGNDVQLVSVKDVVAAHAANAAKTPAKKRKRLILLLLLLHLLASILLIRRFRTRVVATHMLLHRCRSALLQLQLTGVATKREETMASR